MTGINFSTWISGPVLHDLREVPKPRNRSSDTLLYAYIVTINREGMVNSWKRVCASSKLNIAGTSLCMVSEVAHVRDDRGYFYQCRLLAISVHPCSRTFAFSRVREVHVYRIPMWSRSLTFSPRMPKRPDGVREVEALRERVIPCI